MHGAQAPSPRDACLNLSLPRVQDNASPIRSRGSVVGLPAPSIYVIYLAERGSSWEKTGFYACCIGQTGTVVASSCLSPTRLSMSPKANLGSSLCTGWMDKDVAFGVWTGSALLERRSSFPPNLSTSAWRPHMVRFAFIPDSQFVLSW